MYFFYFFIIYLPKLLTFVLQKFMTTVHWQDLYFEMFKRLLFWNVFRSRIVWLPGLPSVSAESDVSSAGTFSVCLARTRSLASHVFHKRVLYRVIFPIFVYTKRTFSTYYDLKSVRTWTAVLTRTCPGLSDLLGRVTWDRTSTRPSWTTYFLVSFIHICIWMVRLKKRRNTIMEAGVHTSVCELLLPGR